MIWNVAFHYPLHTHQQILLQLQTQKRGKKAPACKYTINPFGLKMFSGKSTNNSYSSCFRDFTLTPSRAICEPCLAQVCNKQQRPVLRADSISHPAGKRNCHVQLNMDNLSNWNVIKRKREEKQHGNCFKGPDYIWKATNYKNLVQCWKLAPTITCHSL